ncbi:MAG: DUF3137 domain-containing protein [Acholeplasmataceae bacterium]|nr:DUF3137 domain-containing protein [Acholeplasmataceae bacterium]
MTIEQLQKRKENLDKLFVIIIVLFIMAIAIGFAVHWVFLIAFMIFLCIIPHQNAYKKLILEFKNHHIRKMIDSIIPGLTYIPEKGFDEEMVFESKVLRKFTTFQSEDYLSGIIQGKNFESADVHIVQVVSNGKTTTRITRFLGRLFIVDFQKKFEHDVYISTDKTHNQSIFSEDKKVKTESIEFNKQFHVFSESKHSAFYLLTPRFMEKIEAFSKIAKHVMFAFKDHKAYIAVHTERDAFNLKFDDIIDENYIEFVKVELKLLEDLIAFVPQ